MKKIIPFNNVLEFNTDVKEITAISLEHQIEKSPDTISGTFYISGEYKITEGILEKEKFNFELPFDIALGNNYQMDTLLIDIDDFRYEMISDKSLKVNIDLYIDGDEIEVPIEREINYEELMPDYDNLDIREITDDILSTIPKEESTSDKDTDRGEDLLDKPLDNNKCIPMGVENSDNISNIDDTSNNQEPPKKRTSNDNNDMEVAPERIDLLKDMLTTDKENKMNEPLNIDITNDIENDNDIDILTPNDSDENYVTYRVYKVLENDTIDTILTKYNITKDMLSDYNNIENITPGDKLIIPTNEK